MENSVIYALDFDGVICDSAVETGITGWKAAKELWYDMSGDLPAQSLIDQFRRVRPIIETGYEAILVMRMLYEGEKLKEIFTNFSQKKEAMVEKSGKNFDFLKKLFGETRDDWILHSLDEWVRMNPLFPGLAEKLRILEKQGPWYIVTTKQERFVTQILESNHIQLPGHRIFGLDRNRSKEDTLLELLNHHPEEIIYFVEDRLPTLLNVLQNDKLENVKLFFATWGYNTVQDKLDAAQHPIELQDIENFLQ